MKKSLLLISLIFEFIVLSCAGQKNLQKSKSAATSSTIHPQAVEHFIRGSVSEMVEDYKTALLEFNEALLHDSSSATIHNKVAEAYIRLQKFDSAQKILLNAIRRFPDNVNSYKVLAAIYYSQQELEKAEQVYQKIIQLDPSDLESRYSLITLYLSKDNDLKVAE